MKKYIVLSVNDNPDYLYFTPLTCWAWRKFGWEPIVFHQSTPIGRPEIENLIVGYEDVPKLNWIDGIEGYRSDTITQISRLYGACVADGYLMTGDIDMLPLSDYWKPNPNEVSVYGHDLTGFGHYPICYIGMPAVEWRRVMTISLGEFDYDYNSYIKRDLDTLPQAKDYDFYKRWFCDQDLITARLKEYGTEKISFINRGQYSNGYAKGRVDRGSWTLDHKEFIDAHLHHQIYHKGNEWKFDKTMELLKKVWPEENFDWFVEYHNEFKKLTGHA
jgi:hypothetical protein